MDARLRAHALAERARLDALLDAGRPLDRPQVVLVDELGYHPDFIVADAATSIASAIREHYDPSRTRFIPSLWHLTRAVEADLLRIHRLPVEKALGHRARYEPTMAAALIRDDTLAHDGYTVPVRVGRRGHLPARHGP